MSPIWQAFNADGWYRQAVDEPEARFAGRASIMEAAGPRQGTEYPR